MRERGSVWVYAIFRQMSLSLLRVIVFKGTGRHSGTPGYSVCVTVEIFIKKLPNKDLRANLRLNTVESAGNSSMEQ